MDRKSLALETPEGESPFFSPRCHRRIAQATYFTVLKSSGRLEYTRKDSNPHSWD